MIMVQYGYIDNGGYLVAQEIKEYTEQYRDEKNVVKQRTVTVEEQIDSYAQNGFKPVDPIDEDKLDNCDENYVYHLKPYDAGDRITYEYVKLFDIQKFKSEIKRLKESLSENDYKITKCMEATLLGLELPYNIQDVHLENQAMRDRINEIEDFIKLNIE